MKVREFPGGSRIACEDEVAWGENVQIGPDVVIDCRRLSLGNNVKIGTIDRGDSFRYPGGVRIQAHELIFANDVRVDRHVWIRGGRIQLDRHVQVRSATTIQAIRQLWIGADGTVNEQCEISGVDIVIGRKLWMLPTAKIGGGSATDVHSRLRIGHWCHLGVRSLLNTARPITIGDEVGLGTGTCLYTHGAYASALEGKPVAFGRIAIGDRTWAPGAIVNPSVSIGSDCVIGVGSVVTRDIPSGCLAAGIPAKVLKEGVYPSPLTGQRRYAFLADFVKSFSEICSDRWRVDSNTEDPAQAVIGDTFLGYCAELTGIQLLEWLGRKNSHVIAMTDRCILDQAQLPPGVTVINFGAKEIRGPATAISERLLNQLRRYGIRFNYDSENGQYEPWH